MLDRTHERLSSQLIAAFIETLTNQANGTYRLPKSRAICAAPTRLPSGDKCGPAGEYAASPRGLEAIGRIQQRHSLGSDIALQQPIGFARTRVRAPKLTVGDVNEQRFAAILPALFLQDVHCQFCTEGRLVGPLGARAFDRC